jgi:hypothetical protein
MALLFSLLCQCEYVFTETITQTMFEALGVDTMVLQKFAVPVCESLFGTDWNMRYGLVHCLVVSL